MSQSFDNRIGLEQLQLAVYTVLFQHANDYIKTEKTYSDAIDTALQNLNGRILGSVDLELFDPANMHYGHRPSLITAPLSSYPAFSVSAWRKVPSAQNRDADYGNENALSVAIEVFVKSDIYPSDDVTGVGEDAVGRRAHRVAEAIVRCLDDNRSLGGVFYPPRESATVQLGEIFEREAEGETTTGGRVYWQGARIEYVFPKQSVFGIDQ